MCAGLLVGGVAGTDRTPHRPRPPAGRVVVGPLGQIEVEGPHRGEHAAPVQPRPADLALVRGGLRAGEHALLPGRGDVAGQLQRVDAGVVRLQIGPEQLAEQVGQPLQGGEVHRRLAFAQVVDQHVAHRATRDAVAVDQRLAAGLPTAEEHFDRGGRVRAEVAVRAQQLIKQRALGVAVVGGTGARGGGEQFEAVTDPHRRDVSALNSHDDRDVGQRLLLALQSDSALTQRGQLGERRGVAGAGHLGGQVVPRRGEPQQPVQAGPDHIGADQHLQPRGQVRQRLGAVGADQQPPVRLVLGAAGAPPLLPTIAGPLPQPAQHRQQPQSPVALAERVVQRERRRQHPLHHRRPPRPGGRPRRGHRPRRKRRDQLRTGGFHRSRHRRAGSAAGAHLRRVDDDHDPAPPKRICRLSARYPGAGGVAGSPSRRRA